MKQFIAISVASAALTVCALPASAKWSQVLEFPSAQAVYVSEKGVVYASNLLYNGKGGIRYSYDQGDTWIPANVDDYQYNFFLENDGDVYAIGLGCKIARTTDQGEIWDYLDYSEAVLPYLPNCSPSQSAAYGAAFVGERLYVADLYCGVVYTDDGDNWVMTDRESLKIDDENIECVYSLVNFNGELYALGLYAVFHYDESNNKWEYVRDSNCLCSFTIYDKMLVCGHTITNDDPKTDFLLATADGITWEALARPENLVSNYVRALTSDDKNLYAGMLNQGVYYTADLGETWHDISAGIPKNNSNYCNLISLAQDEKYLYAAVFLIDDTDTNSGIYRVAKEDMENGGGDTPDDGEILMIINPESGSTLSEISSIEVKFNCDMEPDKDDGGYVFRDGIMVQTTVEVSISDDKRTVTYAISPTLTTPGEYTFKYLNWRIRPVNKNIGGTPDIAPVYTIEASGISSTDKDSAPSPIYDLRGIEIQGRPSAGIYIQDGKLLIIKK